MKKRESVLRSIRGRGKRGLEGRLASEGEGGGRIGQLGIGSVGFGGERADHA